MRAEVESSVLRWIEYDAEQRTLDVGFVGGAVYRYFGVPPEVPAALLAAESHGSYFNAAVRPAYRYRRMS